MENQANVRKWAQALSSINLSPQIFWYKPDGTIEYKNLSQSDFKQISEYIQHLESAIVSLVFKQIQSENKS